MQLGLKIGCARCGGKLAIIASIEEPGVIAGILAHLEETAPDRCQAELPLGARSPPSPVVGKRGRFEPVAAWTDRGVRVETAFELSMLRPRDFELVVESGSEWSAVAHRTAPDEPGYRSILVAGGDT